MFEIFCQDDLDRFKASGMYPAVFCDYLQSRFCELKKCLEEFFEDEGQFNLKEFGHMVVLQKIDNLRDLSQIGFNKEDNGVFGDIPEEVALIEASGFSVYEIQTAFNNDFMLQVYLPQGEFELVYPEFQDYLKRWQPSVKFFMPKVESKPLKKPKYSFSGSKYKTSGVAHNVPERVQTFIWDFIAARANSANPPLDYLQVFKLCVEKVGTMTMQKIECVQEQPEYTQSFVFPFEQAIDEKLYLIDDISHTTLILAHEY